MKSISYTRYGAPAVLHLIQRDKPQPKSNQVLVKVAAVSLNPLDWHHVRGKPFPVRLSAGLTRPKPEYQVQGTDIAGTVEAIGADVTRFQVGDSVFGAAPFGGLSEYVAVAEDQLEHLPKGFSVNEAACLPVAGATALLALRDHGKVQAGQRVLINGASGGVGLFSVQIAKAFGAHVTAVCSGRNAELVTSVGADVVVDYTTTDISRSGEQFDVVLDNAGNLSLEAFIRLVRPQGKGVVVGFTSLLTLGRIALFGKRKGRDFGPMMADVTLEVLQTLKSLADEGKLKAVIDRTWPLEQTAEALAYLEGYHARGKVLVTL